MTRLFRFFKVTTAVAAAMAVAMGGNAHADDWVGANDGLGGDGTTWEDPLNWAGGVVPLNNATNIRIGGDHDVVFDADTWAFLQANHAPDADPPVNYLQNATEHRIARLLMGDRTSGAFNGASTLTFDQGAGNTIRATNNNSTVIAARPGKTSTLNVLSGITNLEGSRVRVGQGTDASGVVNLSGGELILGRGGLELSGTDGTGDGTLNISGGSFSTRNDVEIFNGGTFNVEGSVNSIGIGSAGTTDGSWTQSTGGILRTGLDAAGFTSIFIDDVDDDGAGAQGNVTFLSGAILDPYDAGSANNAWTTVMEWEGTLDDQGLVLSAGAIGDGWLMQVVGSELQVRNPNLPDPMNTPGDFDMDGNVDLDDVDVLSSNYGPTGSNTNQDLVADGTIDLADHDEFITTLVPDANGVGALVGDLNLDGDVDVSQISVGPTGVVNVGDASVLLASLGTTSGATYAQGDLNGDGDVDVSQISVGPTGVVNVGDASRLLANLGQSTAGSPAASAVPEPGGMVLLLTAGLGVAMRRRKR